MVWPVEPGRYKVGNPNANVAVCTQASLDIELPLEKIAIIGKCVTENLGIEKIVRNIISNPNIRYLVMCGEPSKGHFVNDAIACLLKNGVDGEKRIIGAKGAMPILKNLSDEEIDRFRKQIKLIDITGEKDPERIMKTIEKLNIDEKFGDFVQQNLNIIKASKNERMIEDPKGFFTISVDYDREKIIVEHFKPDKSRTCIIEGKNAEELYHTICRKGMLSRLEHAAYLGKELAKAEIALKYGLQYEQDSELQINTESK